VPWSEFPIISSYPHYPQVRDERARHLPPDLPFCLPALPPSLGSYLRLIDFCMSACRRCEMGVRVTLYETLIPGCDSLIPRSDSLIPRSDSLNPSRQQVRDERARDLLRDRRPWPHGPSRQGPDSLTHLLTYSLAQSLSVSPSVRLSATQTLAPWPLPPRSCLAHSLRLLTRSLTYSLAQSLSVSQPARLSATQTLAPWPLPLRFWPLDFKTHDTFRSTFPSN